MAPTRKFLKWTEGRQNTSFAVPYLIMWLLPQWLCKLLKRDIVLIKYRKGTRIPQHVDNCKWWAGYDMFRTNITLREATKGGVFQMWGYKHNRDAVNKRGKILGFPYVKFRPDIMPHSVTTVTEGTRLILSIGKLIKNPDRKDITGSCSSLATVQDIRLVFTEMLRYQRTNVFVTKTTNALVMPCVNMWGNFTVDTDVVQKVAEMIYVLNEPEMTMDMCLDQVRKSIPKQFWENRRGPN